MKIRYRHYKGGIYEVICEAKLEPDPSVTMMVYRSQADGAIWTRIFSPLPLVELLSYRSQADGAIWTRPKGVFFEMVEHEGKQVPRFALLPEK